MILTGGDPLMLSPRRLARSCATLGAIEHVKIVRIHTRVPVVAPERIDAGAGRALGARARRPRWRCTPTIRAS